MATLLKKNIRGRHNKIAIGFTYTDERRKKSTGKSRISTYADMNNERKMFLNRMSLYGTGDLLSRRETLHPYMKKVRREHPTDTGYFKEVYIITEVGKKRLATVKKMRERNSPIWYYMSEPINLP